MLLTINFNYQPTLMATEVGDERADGKLPTELDPKPMVAQSRPQALLGIRLLTPKLTRAPGRVRVHQDLIAGLSSLIQATTVN